MNEEPQGGVQAMSPVRDYFTKDVNDKIASMTDEVMVNLLKELEGTAFWTAILRYNQQRLQYVQNALFSGDPVKDPGSMAKTQGVMLGLSDLQNAIILAVRPVEAPEGTTVIGR